MIPPPDRIGLFRPATHISPVFKEKKIFKKSEILSIDSTLRIHSYDSRCICFNLKWNVEKNKILEKKVVAWVEKDPRDPRRVNRS